MNLARATKQELMDEAAKRNIAEADAMTRNQLIDALRAAGVNDEAEPEAPAPAAPIDRPGLIKQGEAVGIRWPMDPQFISDEGLIQLLEQHADGQLEVVDAPDAPKVSNDGIAALNALLEKLVEEKDKKDGRQLAADFVTPEQIRNMPREWVLVPASPEPGGDLPIKIGVQGYVMVIPRDVPCEVPVAALSALRDARHTRFEQDGKVNPQTGQVEFRQFSSLRFPFMTGSAAKEFRVLNHVEETRYTSQVA